jgi:hypothetical protein
MIWRPVALLGRPGSAAWLAFTLVPILGCGSPTENLTSFDGQVTYQESPIARGAVMFFPAEGRPTSTTTDESGRYTARLAHGEYQVTVNTSVQLPPGWQEGDPIPPHKFQLPPQYTTRVRTPLVTTVTDAGAEPTDFDLP